MSKSIFTENKRFHRFHVRPVLVPKNYVSFVRPISTTNLGSERRQRLRVTQCGVYDTIVKRPIILES